MKDLLLFRLLRAPDLDPAALLPLLGDLARLPLAERFPLLGFMPRVLAHPDPSLRAAAVAAIAGADGRPAFLHLVAALGDADPKVRLAAVEALRASSLGHPARFAHALYHPEPDVRRAALAGEWPQGAGAYTFPLLADPVCAPELLRRLDPKLQPGQEAPEAPFVGAAMLPALFDFVARGLLPAHLARRLVTEMSWNDAVGWLRAAVQRSPEQVAAIFEAAKSGPPSSAEHDAFDDVFALFWDEVDEGPSSRRGAFFRRLGSQMLSWAHHLRHRAVASMLITSARRGGWPAAASGIAGLFLPPFLGFSWIPRETRHAAVQALYNARGNVPRLPDEDVKALLRVDLCHRADGKLDLWVVGGILHFIESHPYSHLLRWVGEEAVIEAFVADVDRAIPFLVLRDDSKYGRDYLVERFAQAGGLTRAAVLAILVVATPGDRLDFLDALAAEDAAAMVIELFRVLRRMGTDLPKKAAQMAPLLWKIAKRRDLVASVLAAWLDAESPASLAFGVGVLGAFGVAMTGPEFVAVATSLPAPLLRTLIATLPSCSVFPYGKELALAHELKTHPDEVVRAWAVERAPAPVERLPVARTEAPAAVRRLSEAEIDAVVASSEADLPAAVEPALRAPTAGLCAALARRPAPPGPHVKVCVAILGSHDPMEWADTELGRFGAQTPAFLAALDGEMVRVWEREMLLPPLAHAFIHRWERHAFALVEGFLADGDGLGAQLSRAAALSQPILRVSVWEAVASAFSMWRWRDREKLRALAAEPLGAQLVSALDTDLGEAAARMLAAVADARVNPPLIESLRPAIEEKLPDLTPEARRLLASIADARGLAGTGTVRAASAPKVEENLREKIRRSANLDDLAVWCRSTNPYIVEDAAIRLCELGEPGCARVLEAILAGVPVPGPLYESVSLWHDGASLTTARAFVARDREPPEKRFRLALALAQRGERVFLAYALAAARVETDEPWFTAADWKRLLDFGHTDRTLALALSGAPHPHAYRRAMERLFEVPQEAVTAEVKDAIAAFLEAGTTRQVELRRRAARWLWRFGDRCGFPVLLASKLHAEDTHLCPELLLEAEPDLIEATAEAVLLTGPRAVPESLATQLIDKAPRGPARSRAYERVLVDALLPRSRQDATAELWSDQRTEKLRQLAEAFAWGIRTGRSLTGRLFKIEMITGDGLGYTRMNESRVFVSPLPIFRMVPHGRAIVEGLVLHELGHHLYHRGEEEERCWKQAQAEGIFGLLNTVADEHLERRLRAVDAEYGDRLKRLGAHAFQHASKDVPVAELLESLGGRAFEVLTQTRLDVARQENAVRVQSGALLMQMERTGLAFSRFFRALRMGLGDRHDDPLVREALALCKGIRKRTMPELLDLARRLRALFGWQTQLVESLGTHESFESSEAESTIHGDGITKEELEREIERVLDPKKKSDAGGSGGPGGRIWINVNPDEAFEPIRLVTKVAFDPEEHRRYAAEVAFAARQMRRFLDELGITMEPERFRLRGRRFDTGRALAVVTRGDPRMLIAREPRVRTDLFLGVLVDCSGSMATRGNIEKARLFATMLAEAAKGARGIDLRIYGFNDHTMFDAGDASRCAAHALQAGGGNNDAGALFYAATQARASRRRARLLVMISDGLPTECSVAALRALVTRLGSRYGICCAQVAVQPLAEVCFPHYVVLSESDPAPAVRRFGGIVAELVKRAIAIG
jgi:hypothetical protein